MTIPLKGQFEVTVPEDPMVIPDQRFAVECARMYVQLKTARAEFVSFP